MKNKIKQLMLGVAMVLLFTNCSKKSESASMDMTDSTASTEEFVSSSASENKPSERSFVRSAEMKFKVNDVKKSTVKIEDVIKKRNGYVSLSNIYKTNESSQTTSLSRDSALEITNYNLECEMNFRVPTSSLDTVLKEISKEIIYLDSRVIKADEVSFEMIKNNMQAQRANEYANEIDKARKSKGEMNENTSVDNITNQKEIRDDAKLNQMILKDKIAYSDVHLIFYQKQGKFIEKIALEKAIKQYEPPFYSRAWNNILNGFDIFEEVILFFLNIWIFIAISVGIYFGYKKVKK